jgi:ADP-heptose:LPS heptosyltransferase/GT2 family glycosyltransferase
VPVTPKHILYVRADSFGDLILFAPALTELMQAWPGAKHTLLVRNGYETLAPLFPNKLGWKATGLNPFRSGPAEARKELDAILKDLGGHPPDLIVAPTFHRTWLEVAIAARFPDCRRVALGGAAVDPLFATALDLELGIKADEVFKEVVPADEQAQEWENNYLIVDHLLGQRVERRAPRLSVPAESAARAAQIVAEKKLTAGQWVACYPAGVANVTMKAWASENFAETIVWLEREHRLPVMLLGHRSEAAIVDSVADLVVKLGRPRPPVWLSNDGEIPLMAALLATAKFYLGNDTGPMHLAASVDVPLVGIFGGGFWPRFKPVGRQVVSVVQPLPCFGCQWDCHFGDAPCVKTLAVADVQAAITRLLAAKADPLELVVETKNLSTESHHLIAAATPLYKKLQADRLDRQYKIEELTHLDREKDIEIADLKRAAEERKVEMESIKAELEAECAQKDTEIDSLKQEANTKDTEITDLKKETDTKDVEIDSLKSEADTKDTEIGQLKSEANTKDAEIDRLKAVCNEREALIFKLTDIVKDFQGQVARLQEVLGRKEQELAQLTASHKQLTEVAKEHDKLKLHFAALPPDATQYGQWLHDKDVHIGNIEAMLADARRSLENYARGYGELEQIKRYSLWLHEKESVIQQLKRACDEREALIRQMVGEAAGLGRVRRVARGLSEYFRQKIREPLREKFFHRMVEEHWMQIGVLRQYEPRLLTWDAGLRRKPRIPDAKLPAIDVVTPSYNQDKFLESTILSVLNQGYPKLRYRVQDGGSKDGSVAIIQRYADRLAGWVSEKDRGQADAVCRGFQILGGEPTDIMAWLNSDDLLAPRSLRFVAEYFVSHPEVDVIYGHRIIIDEHDREIGRWIMPRHDPKSLEWIDYVPQETMFFRRSIYEAVGGLDSSFQFALDWDLLARFQQAKARVVRLPYFLGCFRLHSEQKTSQHIHTQGFEEMTRIRTRIHGPVIDNSRIDHYARKTRLEGAIISRCLSLGIRI